MYLNTISAVKINNSITPTFKSEVGVKQGHNLSPTLFNVYLNDLKFPEDSCDPIKLSSVSLSHLLWADDLLIMSQSSVGLQKCLDVLHNYCKEWKLCINIEKSNVMIIEKGKRAANSNTEFRIGDQTLTYCKEYKYLGCIINSSGNFTAAKKDLSQKAAKVLYKLQRSFASVSPPPELYYKLFDTLVKPVALYNCEIWATDNVNRLIKYDSKKVYELSENDQHERLHTKFCKGNLRVKCKSVNIACRAELGRFPLTLDVNTQIIKYHNYLDNLSLSRPILLDTVKCSKNLNNVSWHKYSETLMYKNNVRLENLQRTANNETKKSESLKIKKKLQENYLEFYYKEKLASSEKLTLYKHLDRNYSLAPYLSKIKNHNFRQALTKMRISAHKLEIETGRYTKTTREERLCKLCSLEVEDELQKNNFR